MSTKKTSKAKLPNDYERMIPEYHKQNMIYGEHIVRYEVVADIVRGKVVLDIASGSGYGTALLAKTARQVIGVDVNEPAIAYSKENYNGPNITYKVGDGVSIPLEDNAVDIVVSFETIEHIEDYRQFMNEVKRVLKDDGLLLLSTPNDVEFAEGNHFHIHEFEHEELRKLVGKYFKNTEEYFQATWLFNAVMTERDMGSEWQKPLQTMQTAPVPPNKAIYFFMLCANRKITEKLEALGAISEHWSQRQISKTEEQTQKLIKQQEMTIEKLRPNEELLREAKAENARLTAELKEIINSKAWKLATSLRKAKGTFKKG